MTATRGGQPGAICLQAKIKPLPPVCLVCFFFFVCSWCGFGAEKIGGKVWALNVLRLQTRFSRPALAPVRGSHPRFSGHFRAARECGRCLDAWSKLPPLRSAWTVTAGRGFRQRRRDIESGCLPFLFGARRRGRRPDRDAKGGAGPRDPPGAISSSDNLASAGSACRRSNSFPFLMAASGAMDGSDGIDSAGVVRRGHRFLWSDPHVLRWNKSGAKLRSILPDQNSRGWSSI